MNIGLTPAYMDKMLFARMAKEYTETLAQYDPKIRWDEVAWSDRMWDSYFIMEDRTVQGFIVMTTVLFEVYSDILYIEDFYVVPEARGKGIGLAAVKEAIRGWNKDVFLYVLNNNSGAKVFWTVVESELEWKRINRPEIRNEEGCELRVYQTR